jgi:hypothetical protein
LHNNPTKGESGYFKKAVNLSGAEDSTDKMQMNWQ